MQVLYEKNNKIINTNVYDISYDKAGYPHFLLYIDNQWVRVSAKHCTPIEGNTLKIGNYIIEVMNRMEEMGATKNDYKLVSIELICNAMRNNRKPEDVAWAILQ